MARRHAMALVLMLVAGVLGVVRPAAAACASAAHDLISAQRAAHECRRPVEALSRRSGTSRTTVNPDGTYRLELTASPRWAKRPDGTWGDIDTTLRTVGGVIAPVLTDVPVRFSAGGDGPLVTATTDGGPVSLSWPARLPAPRLDGDTAVYPDVRPGVDLRVRALATGFTYVLVVRTRNADISKISMTVGGATFDGSRLLNKRGQTALTTGGATMWDSADRGNPDGPGDLSRSREVTIKTDKTSITLQPDRAMLADPATRLPLYIDPQISGLNRWAYADSTNANRNDGIARAGVSPDGSGTFRSFFEFDISAVTGGHVFAAEFSTLMVHSYSCTSTPVSLWATGAITGGVNGTRVGWSPALSLWLDQQSGHAHKPGGDPGCAGDPQPDQELRFDNLLTGMVQDWASSGWTGVTLGLSAAGSGGSGESTANRWKKFWVPSTGLTILYNSYPDPPGDDDLATVGTSQTVACDGDEPRVSGANGVTFSAALADDDEGDAVVGRFEWQDLTAGSDPVTLADTPGFTSPHTFTGSVPAAAVPDGHEIQWRVHGWDGTDDGDPSPWCRFRVDNATPGQPRLTEMMLMSTSRRGLTHRLTDFGSSTGFVGLGREVLVHSLDVAL